MKALLIVDLQYDFLPGGTLAVPEGNSIIPVVNKLIPYFNCIIQTQDWHPKNHSSFASNNAGKEPYDTITLNYGEQVLWPDHCVQGTKGAELHPELEQNATQLIIRKGFRPHIDSYSAFYENDQETTTGLHGHLQERGVTEVYITGLATDFCVKWSALDSIKKGYKTFLVEDGVRGIDIENSVELAFEEMSDAGVKIITSREVPGHFE